MALTGTIVLFLSLYSPLVLSPVLSSTSPSRHPHPLHLVLPSPLLPLQLLTLSISPSASLLLPRPLLLLLCNFCNIYLQAKGFFIKEAWFLKYLKSIFWLFYFPYLRYKNINFHFCYPHALQVSSSNYKLIPQWLCTFSLIRIYLEMIFLRG